MRPYRHLAWLSALLVLAGACGSGVPPADETPAPEPEDGLHVRTAALPEGDVGTSYAARVEAAGGTGVGQSWRLVEGSLPPGLELDGGPRCLAWQAWQVTGALDPLEAEGGLREVSGLAASRRNPGVLWAHDDSGSQALLYAVGEDGHVRQRYVLDTQPIDWEDVAIGPGPSPDAEYLYVGDVGDNGKARPFVSLVRVEEPLVPDAPGAPVQLPHQSFALRYPGGPRDVEAVVVDWETGTPYLLEKDGSGGDAFRPPGGLDPAWTPADPAELVPVTTGRPLPADLTAADAGRDAARIVLRSYFSGAELVRPPDETFEAIFEATPCALTVPLLGQYEALALGGDGTTIHTTTELVLGDTAPLHRADASGDDGAASITGVPTTAGRWTLVFEVRESTGERARCTLELVVR